MKMLWGLSEPGATYRTARTKLIDSEAIERPTFLHIGTTTEDAFYHALSLARSLIVSGWLNRYLIRRAARRGEEQDLALSLIEGVPKPLANTIKKLVEF